ncbi:hypothetical protein C4K13_0327 [Pseudomonas chlororaphis subsp. aureofaciens]|nr:hypothetical protein C4K14_0328 [Pseudomonas chlororaphis subsp. aureofaciens]AZD89775.1 hypothetical protein C4K13_0327 [Pseudomonas chlororaphis subsp. aureofaciens]AZD96225.1 hypothetical protein C4K12_0328 [Pseudomonas chlororaphis subsp. aureofaciens]
MGKGWSHGSDAPVGTSALCLGSIRKLPARRSCRVKNRLGMLM